MFLTIINFIIEDKLQSAILNLIFNYRNWSNWWYFYSALNEEVSTSNNLDHIPQLLHRLRGLGSASVDNSITLGTSTGADNTSFSVKICKIYIIIKYITISYFWSFIFIIILAFSEVGMHSFCAHYNIESFILSYFLYFQNDI